MQLFYLAFTNFIVFCPLAILFLVIALCTCSRVCFFPILFVGSPPCLQCFFQPFVIFYVSFQMSKTKKYIYWFYRFSCQFVHASLFHIYLPARALHARTQVTVYHSKPGHYLLSLPNTSSHFLVDVNISSVLQFYRNEHEMYSYLLVHLFLTYAFYSNGKKILIVKRYSQIFPLIA